MDFYNYYVLLYIDDLTIAAGVKEFEEILKRELAAADCADSVKVLETGSSGLKDYGIEISVYPGDVHYGNLSTADIDEIVHEHFIKGRVVTRLVVKPSEGQFKTSELGPQDVRLQNRIVLSLSGVIDPENIFEYFAEKGYEAIGKILEEKVLPEQVVEIIKASGLQGRGGAGFPTGLKWEFAHRAEGDQKYIICNADEGEPGTFKDRLILEGNPHLILEGMLIAGYATGAENGYIYIRGEYDLSIKRMEKALAQAYEYNLLGHNLFGSGFSFDIEIKKGAGAYVCGEETSLIESMEGKRGIPRLKPPFPGTRGLKGSPTVVNNVETLANIAPIILKGADWFRSFGTKSCPGTKVFTILGDVRYT
ncbi:MAG: NADP oxidoreductase, partial [Spirochaetes bacterium]